MTKNYPNIFRIYIFLSLIGILAITESCSSSEQNNENKMALPIYRVDTGTVVLEETFLGTVEGKSNVEIRPQVEGELQRSYVDEGDHVEKGEKLFKINPQKYQQKLNQAIADKNVSAAELNNARMEVERLKPLLENDVMAPVKLEKEKSNYEVAKANLKQDSASVAEARIQLDYTNIKAPVSGYIGRIPKKIGNVVSPGDDNPITTLSDVDEVYVYFSMSEANFYNVLKKQNNSTTTSTSVEKDGAEIDTNRIVSLTLPDGTLYPYKGVIDASSGQVNKNTGSIVMRATFPNPENMLRSGNTGTLILKKRRNGEVIIPKKATFELQTETFVKKLTPENRVVDQSIEVGSSAPNNIYTVTRGLKKGDRILTEGLQDAEENTKVKPLPYQPDTLEKPKVFPQDYDSAEMDTSRHDSIGA